jgi:hypothetical protein
MAFSASAAPPAALAQPNEARAATARAAERNKRWAEEAAFVVLMAA